MDNIPINISDRYAVFKSDDIFHSISERNVSQSIIGVSGPDDIFRDISERYAVSKLDMDFCVEIMCIFWVSVFMIMVCLWCNHKK